MISRQQIETKDELLSSIKSKSILIFSSATCPPCKQLASFLDTFQTDKDVPIFELKVPHFKDLVFFKPKFRLTSFPTCVVVDKDLNEIEQKVGFGGGEDFKEFINKHF